jgi:hypothetical protein
MEAALCRFNRLSSAALRERLRNHLAEEREVAVGLGRGSPTR